MLKDLDCHGMTDRGRERESNQDQFLIADLVKTLQVTHTSLHVDDHASLSGQSQGKLLLVADGMGGHQGGERASSLAIESLSTYLLNTMHWFFRLEADREQDFEHDLKAALATCNSIIREEAAAIPEEHGMGTTLTMAYVIWPRMYVVHVGDSRCYVQRGSTLKQITVDHTFAEQFVEAGVMQPEDAAESRWSHVLWNVVGGSEESLQPVVYKCGLSAGDTVLLCSDGLTRHVDDQTITAILEQRRPASEMSQQLVERANEGGGTDNITVVVARF